MTFSVRLVIESCAGEPLPHTVVCDVISERHAQSMRVAVAKLARAAIDDPQGLGIGLLLEDVASAWDIIEHEIEIESNTVEPKDPG